MQPKAHDLGNLFVQRLELEKGSALYLRAPTQETEYPFRRSRSRVFRFPGTGFGIALGWWRDTGFDEHDALIESVQGLDLGDIHKPGNGGVSKALREYSVR